MRARERLKRPIARPLTPTLSPQAGRGGFSRGETAIGVISGTSMDGIDVALIASDGEALIETGPAATFPYPERVAERLRAVVASPSEAEAPQAELERLVTNAHVAAVEAFLKRFSVARESVSLIGLHGQTILHRPRAGVTRQLCDGARAAAALKIDVVSDFRSADVAAGGEGAPLAPVYHAAMAANLERPLMILNWGGVGNVTYLGAEGEIIAFDTGPANALIDDFLLGRRGRAFDEDGALAKSGRIDAQALAILMRDPYFDRPPPKSLDRNHFGALAACVERLSDADGAATLSAFTVEATAAALKHVPQAPARWLVGGGRAAELEPHAPARRAASSQGRAGRGDRLRRRQHRGAMFRLSRPAFAARGAALLSDHDRRSGAMTGGAFWPAPK